MCATIEFAGCVFISTLELIDKIGHMRQGKAPDSVIWGWSCLYTLSGHLAYLSMGLAMTENSAGERIYLHLQKGLALTSLQQDVMVSVTL